MQKRKTKTDFGCRGLPGTTQNTETQVYTENQPTPTDNWMLIYATPSAKTCGVVVHGLQ